MASDLNEKNLKKVQKLLEKRSSSMVLEEAFGIICPQKENWLSFIIILLMALISAVIIGISNDTVQLYYKAVEIINNVILVLFGVVFTGYAFFQALINNELLKRLIETDVKKDNKKEEQPEDSKSLLQESNEYFVNVMMLNVVEIIINVIQLIIVGSISKDFRLPISLAINNLLASALIGGYFIFSFLIIWEMKSFVYNTFQLFNAHAGAKAIEIIKRNGDEI